MIRLRNAVVALATGLLATGALAQTAHFTQDSQAATAAEELFGSGAVKLEFDEFRGTGSDDAWVPKAKLIFGGGDINAGSEFHVTLTLSNATFAEPVSNSDFMWGTFGPADTARGGLDCDDTTTGTEGDAGVTAGTGDNASMTVFCPAPTEVALERTGGGKNTNSVSFKVTVGDTALSGNVVPALNDADPAIYVGTTRKIVFAVPDLNATGLRAANDEGKGGKSVGVMVGISQPKSGGTTIMESVKDAHMCGETEVVKSPGTAACPVVSAAKVITGITATAGTGTMISLVPTDERAVLVGGDGKAVDPQRAHLATVTVAANFAAGARDQDGDMIDADYGFSNDLAGSLAITVASAGFNDDDKVYIDSNGNKKVDGREEFEMDGVAADTVPLAAGPLHVFYVPSGDDALKHRTSFSTTAHDGVQRPGQQEHGARRRRRSRR